MGDWIGSSETDVELLDGSKYHVRTIFADIVAYEQAARVHKWGPVTETGMQAIAFTVWHALRRTGDIAQTVKYETFRDTIVALRQDDGEEAPDPTVAGPLPD